MFFDEKSHNPSLDIATLEDVDSLTASSLPCVLWGGGEVAEIVISFLKTKNIIPDVIWIDNYNQGDFFHNIPVLGIDNIIKKYNSFNVVVGHNRYDLISDINKKYNNINRIFAFSNIFGWDEQFNENYIVDNEEAIYKAYEFSEDEISKKVFEEYILCRIKSNPFYIKSKYILNDFFKNNIIDVTSSEGFLDVGACKGNMIKSFLKSVNGCYKRIYAIEPEEENYKELKTYLEKNTQNYFSKKIGCWNKKTSLNFELEGTGRSNHVTTAGDGEYKIDVDKIDNIISDGQVTIMNFCIQTGIIEMLEGAERIIKDQKPKLIICIGLRKNHFYNIPLLIQNMNPEYKIYYRFMGGLPARLYLLAV